MTATEDFDVIVIGAGIAGAGLAAELSDTRRVVLLERESQPGVHATGRSAALFSGTYGNAVIRALSRASLPFFQAPPEGFADAPLIRPRGCMHIASAAQRDKLEAYASLPDVERVSRRLSPADVLALCPLLRPDHVEFGLLEPDASDLDVNTLHQGFLRRLRANGGVLATDAGVEAIERGGPGWRVRGGGQWFAAPIVANAAGAWVDQIASLAGIAPLGVQPKRRTAILVDPPEGLDIRAWPAVIDGDEQFYFKPDAGLLLLSPADETDSAPCDAQPDEWDIALAVDRVEAATSLQVRRVRHRWAGLRSFFADRTPVAGFDETADGFFWLAGQGGYGIQTAPALSRVAAALLAADPMPSDVAELGLSAVDLAPARLRNAAQP